MVSRFMCAFTLTSEQSEGLVYREPPDAPIGTIVFQCKKFFQTCCGLDCCDTRVRALP